jgi:hypothetical protein
VIEGFWEAGGEAMSTAESFPPFFPHITDPRAWSKQHRKRWRLVGSWLDFEYQLLEQELGRTPTIAERRERAQKVLDAIWDEDAQWEATKERWKAEQAAKVVPLRPDPSPA